MPLRSMILATQSSAPCQPSATLGRIGVQGSSRLSYGPRPDGFVSAGCHMPAPPRGRSADDLVRVTVESHVPSPVRVLRSSPLWFELLCAALLASPCLSPYGAPRYLRPADPASGPRTASSPRHHPAPGV